MIEKQIRFTYEPGNPGEGYIELSTINRNVASQIRIEDGAIEGIGGFKGEIIIDLSKQGKIIGIEILGDVLSDDLKG